MVQVCEFMWLMLQLIEYEGCVYLCVRALHCSDSDCLHMSTDVALMCNIEKTSVQRKLKSAVSLRAI